MKPSHKVTLYATSLLLVALVASVISREAMDRARPSATLEEVLFLNSPKMVKRLSLGYDGLMANLYWTRAVQYFGTKQHISATSFNLLPPLLHLTTALDPELSVAYHFGANFLAPKPPLGAGMPGEAVKLIEFGIQNNPNDWKLYYDLGFIYYLEYKDYQKAFEAFDRGTKVPKAHPFLRVLAAQMATHAGEIETARMLWTTAYENTKDKQIRANARVHLRALRVDEEVTNLEKAVAFYRQRYGRLPASLSSLQAAGIISGSPVDPKGKPYQLTADGRIQVRDPDDFPFIEKGLPPGYQPGPPNLKNFEE